MFVDAQNPSMISNFSKDDVLRETVVQSNPGSTTSITSAPPVSSSSGTETLKTLCSQLNHDIQGDRVASVLPVPP